MENGRLKIDGFDETRADFELSEDLRNKYIEVPINQYLFDNYFRLKQGQKAHVVYGTGGNKSYDLELSYLPPKPKKPGNYPTISFRII